MVVSLPQADFVLGVVGQVFLGTEAVVAGHGAHSLGAFADSGLARFVYGDIRGDKAAKGRSRRGHLFVGYAFAGQFG
jgi:hypothetical protein